MANEKEQVQKTTANAATDKKDVKSNTVASDKYHVIAQDGLTIIPDITVKRRPYEVKGEEFYEYFAEGKWGEKTLEILLSANTVRGTEKRFKDRDTYEMLDGLFETNDELYLGVKVVSGIEGRKTVSYFVVGISERGVLAPMEVNIERPSSRSKLTMLINEAAAKYDVTLPSII